MAKTQGLTPRQQAFVEAYLQCLNGAEAARRAGYSPKAAKEQGARLLTNANVQAAIAEATEARKERCEVDADRVLRELADVAFSSVWHYQIGDDGRVTLAPDAPASAIRAVSSIKHKVRHDGAGKVEHDVEIRLWPKVEALEKLGRHLGLFKPEAQAGPQVSIQVLVGVDEAKVLGKSDGPG